jgi:hypothetical protein
MILVRLTMCNHSLHPQGERRVIIRRFCKHDKYDLFPHIVQEAGVCKAKLVHTILHSRNLFFSPLLVYLFHYPYLAHPLLMLLTHNIYHYLCVIYHNNDVIFFAAISQFQECIGCWFVLVLTIFYMFIKFKHIKYLEI